MYGLIHTALNQLVVENYGEDAWLQIVKDSGVPADSFLTMRSYDDSVTLALVASASRALDAPVDDCLKLFGRFWMTTFAPQDYSMLLDAAGSHLFDFLESLDALHDRISTTFVGYVPPSFLLTRQSETSAQLEYISGRQGMLPFVLGLLEGMQERFNVTINIDVLDLQQTPEGDRAMIRLQLEERS